MKFDWKLTALLPYGGGYLRLEIDMKKVLYLLSILFLASCGDPVVTKPVEGAVGEEETPVYSNLEPNFLITGQIKNAANMSLTLEALSNKGAIKLAEAKTQADGKFAIKGNIQGFGLYQLKLGSGNKIIPLTIEPKDTVRITADYETFERLPKITGTEWSDAITQYMFKFNDFAAKQTELLAKQGLSEEQQIKEFMQLRKPLDAFAKAEMLKNPGNPANIVLSTSMTPAMGFENWDPANLEVLKKVAAAYDEKYSGSPIANSLAMQVQQIESGLAEYKGAKSSPRNGAGLTAPEIALKNPEGKTIKLSSLRGKVVLVDFWASWCGPCRQENPNVVKAYNKFKDKGFTVYSVSLDNDAAAWKRAIKSDGLIWPNHVSDLLQWKSSMPQLYGFDGIPYTVLLDKQGKIIGTNLRGPALEQKLSEILK